MDFAHLLLAAALAAGSTANAASNPIDDPADPTSPSIAADVADVEYVVLSRQTFDGARLPTRAASTWIDSRGRELVVAELDPMQVGVLSRHIHQNERRCGGFFAFGSRPEAEAFVARERAVDAVAQPLGALYTIDNPVTVNAWLPQVSGANIHATIASLSASRNRYYSSSYGRQAPESIRDSWRALAGDRADVAVELFTQCSNCSTQASVIMTVRGAERPDEIVVVGGHLDSINWTGNNPGPEDLAPGADDDASGIATITEIIRIAMASGWQPKRTVKFMGYAAEEVGLRGSNAIATRFKADGANVVGALQLDMTNYKDGAPYDIQIVTDNSDAALIAYFGELFDAYLAPLGLVRAPLECGYGCSDHASWTEAGYPAGMVFEAGRPRDASNPWDLGDFQYIHSDGDTLTNMDDSAEHSVKFAQFGLAFVGEMAKTSDRLFADGFDP